MLIDWAAITWLVGSMHFTRGSDALHPSPPGYSKMMSFHDVRVTGLAGPSPLTKKPAFIRDDHECAILYKVMVYWI
ncbi:hypothetical protein KKF34_11835 [Myxococcota bacterium]|nr:hypothetical protein [Myxococcota bacterium]MBU1383041.1 hypothetical protein [Myxococcota bacterium]MBU1497554.1 hypothetical protein [Myxococcota bacterium]